MCNWHSIAKEDLCTYRFWYPWCVLEPILYDPYKDNNILVNLLNYTVKDKSLINIYVIY
jgi:hypothetical protein